MDKIYLLLAIMFPFSIAAQTGSRTISGVVVSADNSSPLEGVTVTVKGTGKVSGTQADGVYYIKVADQDTVLVFTSESYQPQELKVSSLSQLDVRLHKADGFIEVTNADEESAGMTQQPAFAVADDQNKPLVIEGYVYFEGTSNPAGNVYLYIIEGEEEYLTDRNGYFRIESWQKSPLHITVKQPAKPAFRFKVGNPSSKQVIWIK